MLHIYRQSSSVVVEKRGNDGGLLFRCSSKFLNERDFAKHAETLQISAAHLKRCVDEFNREGTDAFPDEPTAPKHIELRPMNATHGQAFGTLSEVMACYQPDYLIVSKSSDKLAFVDVDVEDGQQYDYQFLWYLMQTFQPRPRFAWVTRSGGLRLCYEKSQHFDADELAAIATFILSQTIEYRRIELPKQTRVPPNGFYEFEQTEDVSAFRSYFRSSIEDKTVEQWLEERGLKLNQRYPHSVCPVDPSNTGKSDCLIVLEQGLFCFICQAHGVTYGSKRAGFFPYSAFCSRYAGNVIEQCVKNNVHFTHAKHLLAHYYNVDDVWLADVYRALIKLFNDTPLARQTIQRGTNLVRVGREWCNVKGEPYTKSLDLALSNLPAVQYIDEENKVHIDKEKLATFLQPFDLSEYGYIPLRRVYGLQTSPTSEPCLVIPPSYLTANFPDPKAGDLSAAWAVLEDIFPEVNRNYITLLLCARVFADRKQGLPPMIYVCGPTSSAKTSSIQLAAGILGDYNTAIQWDNSIERVRQGIADAKAKGTFVTFNEVIKGTRYSNKNPVEALDFVLNLTHNSTSHKLYTGHVELGDLPVVLFTDTDLPEEIREDGQLSRRLVVVRLNKSVAWEGTIANAGLTRIETLRQLSETVAHACDVILYHSINTAISCNTFNEAAALLGFSRSQDTGMNVQLLWQFKAAVDAAPPLTGSDLTRWGNNGWKRIRRDGQDEISLLWESLCDDLYDGFNRSRKCSEFDWEGRFVFEVKSHGNTVVVRFKDA